MTTQTEVVVRQKQERGSTIWLRRVRALAQVWTLLALMIFFSLVSTSFLHPNNLNNILVQISTLAILGTGMTFVLLTGQIDLSIASLVTLTGIVSAHLFNTVHMAEPWSTIVALGAASACELAGIVSGRLGFRFTWRAPRWRSSSHPGSRCSG